MFSLFPNCQSSTLWIAASFFFFLIFVASLLTAFLWMSEMIGRSGTPSLPCLLMLIGHGYCTVWAVHMFVLSFCTLSPCYFCTNPAGFDPGWTGVGLFTGGNGRAKRHHDGESRSVTGLYVGKSTEMSEESEVSQLKLWMCPQPKTFQCRICIKSDPMAHRRQTLQLHLSILFVPEIKPEPVINLTTFRWQEVIPNLSPSLRCLL